MNKGLFILNGACFRDGQSGSQLKDTPFGIKNQTECSESHCKLANSLTSYHIDIAINTYKTIHTQILKDIYHNINYLNFNDNIYTGTQTSVEGSIKNTLSNVNIDDYDFVFICRIDLLLKDDFINKFNPKWKRIIYPNVMSIWDKNESCISDVFVFIPCKYFNEFGNWKGLIYNSRHILHHHALDDVLKNGLLLKEDIDFVTNLTYVANTSQMKNPLYAINCRAQGPEFYQGYSNKMYIKETHTVIDI
jgi:hypothetical protein